MAYALEAIDCSVALTSGSISDVKAKGISVVIRYLGTGSKSITKDECDLILNSGLGLCLCYEAYGGTQGEVLNGDLGRDHGADARARLDAIDCPARVPVYFAVDYDAQSSDMTNIYQYLLGANTLLDGGTAVGNVALIYGGKRVVDYIGAHYGGRHWQTYAWSNGLVSPYASLLQYSNDHNIGSLNVDYDTILLESECVVWRRDGDTNIIGYYGDKADDIVGPDAPGGGDDGDGDITNVGVTTAMVGSYISRDSGRLLTFHMADGTQVLYQLTTNRIWIPSNTGAINGGNNGGHADNQDDGDPIIPPPADPTNPADLPTATQVQNAFAAYMKAHNNTYSVGGHTYTVGNNGCPTLTAWFIGEYTTLDYGFGNGEDVAGNLGDTSSTPTPIAVFSVAGGANGGRGTWGSSGGQYGHTGLVLAASDGTATVLSTWAKLASNTHRSQIAHYSYPDPDVKFFNIPQGALKW